MRVALHGSSLLYIVSYCDGKGILLARHQPKRKVNDGGVAVALMDITSVNAGLMAARPAALAPGSGVEFWRYAIRRARLGSARTSPLGLAPRASCVPRI